eukprot:2880879-Alexandrium_andersonii.AAC.1
MWSPSPMCSGVWRQRRACGFSIGRRSAACAARSWSANSLAGRLAAGNIAGLTSQRVDCDLDCASPRYILLCVSMRALRFYSRSSCLR